jgi:hypothetical protein
MLNDENRIENFYYRKGNEGLRMALMLMLMLMLLIIILLKTHNWMNSKLRIEINIIATTMQDVRPVKTNVIKIM